MDAKPLLSPIPSADRIGAHAWTNALSKAAVNQNKVPDALIWAALFASVAGALILVGGLLFAIVAAQAV